ncbi:hypothetical protein TAL182_PC00393 (plasmid) [Rhizobium sp. TAL182]|nr:hypothetical protein TAL182_PC00393 [Rhizobium sp. TAL182]
MSVSIASQFSSRHWQRNPPSNIVKGLAQHGFTGSVARANLKQATPSFKTDQTPGQFSLTPPMRLRLRRRRRRASRKPAAGSMFTVAIERG